MPSSYIAYSLLIFIGVSLAFILISLAFLAISSHKSFREIKSTSLWMLIGSFLLITIELMLSLTDDSLQFLSKPCIGAQLGIFFCLLINCGLLIYCFSKYQNNKKYASLNESVLILGIMQVTICMSITSAFQNAIFILQIAANSVYLLLPALVIYEFSKTSSISPKGKYLLNQAKKRKDKDSP
ncbi:hypothetical protein [Neisseria mucosa]|uniref:hypothetical protein n=1 Tax=Neisseria mucosa TaxID=488 RepID=UPI001F363C13|nr:hypothetical protein [Neisseria mucosa]